MAKGLLEDRAELEALFDELNLELAALGTTAHVVMVGGAWMLWHSHRRSTRDVDSARKLSSDLAATVEKIAERHPQDREDLVSLWPLCDFTDPQAAAQAFQDAYPHAPKDDFLPDYIADLAREAAS